MSHHEEDELNELKAVELADDVSDEVREEHRTRLEAAYAAFQAREADVPDSNPAEPGESFIDAAVVVTTEEPEAQAEPGVV
jgi:hypothetical protein